MAKTPRTTLLKVVAPIRPSDLTSVGMILSSFLTEPQFQALNGNSWVLIDGRSVAGSRFAEVTGITTLPDARGMVLRGKNNGRSDGKQNPDGEMALGSYQADIFGSHDHGGGNHSHGAPMNIHNDDNNGTDGQNWGRFQHADQPTTDINGAIQNSGVIIATQGGNETRMKNIAVNHFIKINP